MVSTKDEIKMRFLRVTLIGGTGCGKTSLINCFVNGMCPARYTKTEKAQVFYRKVDIDDEGEYLTLQQPVFVEIEDTPGSERGNEDDDAGSPSGGALDGSEPKPRLGSRVCVEKDKNKLIAHFEEFNKRGGKLRYKPLMDSMLGKEYTVKTIGKDGSFGLPSLDGSEGGVWNFPPGALSLKMTLELPISQYLTLAEKKKPDLPSLSERKKYALDMQSPMLAYNRPIGGPDMDKTLTRNRMGFFVCFDLSDDEGNSLKEAMEVHRMLSKSLAHKTVTRLKPFIWLVGCKRDKASEDTMEQNRDSAQVWSEQEEIPFYMTSARTHKGVFEVFTEMIQAISSRENLWNLEDPDGEELLEEEQGNCFGQ